MTHTERDELAAAIREHFPGLPDGAVEWLTDGAAVAIGRSAVVISVCSDAFPATPWGAYHTSGPLKLSRVGPTASEIVGGIRGRFVAALATARADVEAYERALGSDR